MICCWSVKGGSGTTVVASALALVLARGSGNEVLMVDLAGDVPAALGMPEPEGPGLSEWMGAGDDVPVDGLARIEIDVAPGLSLLARGQGDLGPRERVEVLAAMLEAEARTVVVDAGCLEMGCADLDGPAAIVASHADRSLLVTRPCFLALRRAVSAPIRPTGIICVTEPGRALSSADVESVIGVPVVAEVGSDEAVARAVDAGLLVARMPRGLERVLRRAA